MTFLFAMGWLAIGLVVMFCVRTAYVCWVGDEGMPPEAWMFGTIVWPLVLFGVVLMLVVWVMYRPVTWLTRQIAAASDRLVVVCRKYRKQKANDK